MIGTTLEARPLHSSSAPTEEINTLLSPASSELPRNVNLTTLHPPQRTTKDPPIIDRIFSFINFYYFFTSAGCSHRAP
ncbi:uncharacterized protein H6S33_010875 [Morchella sextelata]|uniref:uncharacterized protein n=1 Tax=Morchella sextelata TaxID=1174677 RepID=UPI001D03A62B|nr:uncharacterized protein H6S33_010875 [Morchella sextelata]KAH0611610.1 hypothetical protein H6S33_010875 [Morchella sextelata]